MAVTVNGHGSTFEAGVPQPLCRRTVGVSASATHAPSIASLIIRCVRLHYRFGVCWATFPS
jgi:hypothetical protein